MAPKRPSGKDKLSPDDWQITDEWGIYDPAKAGMQALYARLGRPILTASPSRAKRDRRRGSRPERPSDGVGLAIEEARRRAGLDSAATVRVIPQSPARAMRAALKARAPEPSAAEAVAAVALPQATPPVVTPPEPTAPKRRGARRVAPPAMPEAAPAQAVDGAARPEPQTRKAVRGRRKAADAAAAAPPATSPGTARPTAPPAPSPRRPRGHVPLAAWAHAANDAPTPPTRPGDGRGFWRGVFRIPPEVALVEYAHGCRIQRLLIEAAPETPADFI